MNRPKLIQQSFEIRYEQGYRYLDRCGEAMLILEELLPSETSKTWMPEEIAPTGAKLKCPDLDTVVTFNTFNMVVEQNPGDFPKDFTAIATSVFAIISARFDLRKFVRAGSRRFYLAATDSVEEAEQLSVKTSPFSDWPLELPEGMSQKAVEATSVVENADGSGYRFSVRPSYRVQAPLQADPRLRLPPKMQPEGQRKALLDQLKRQSQREREPVAGVLLDVDCYVVKPLKLEVQDFLHAAIKTADDLVSAFGKGKSHVGDKQSP